jgi:hypothetical protein
MDHHALERPASRGGVGIRPSVVRKRFDVGDYLCTERDLYCIVQLGEERAIVEDCRDGELFDLPLVDLLLLRRVRRT